MTKTSCRFLFYFQKDIVKDLVQNTSPLGACRRKSSLVYLTYPK